MPFVRLKDEEAIASRNLPVWCRSIESEHATHERVVQEELLGCKSCTKEEGRSSGVGFQERASNPSKLLRLRAVGVSVGVKALGVILYAVVIYIVIFSLGLSVRVHNIVNKF
jgi:hypothetical protein